MPFKRKNRGEMRDSPTSLVKGAGTSTLLIVTLIAGRTPLTKGEDNLNDTAAQRSDSSSRKAAGQESRPIILGRPAISLVYGVSEGVARLSFISLRTSSLISYLWQSSPIIHQQSGSPKYR
ncbi:hypothetical protein L218DRAFT_951884 [Marasmius fiardii PR-910]|nr:hypothetical protein L218DRAFT_951884 [Marasmius fiardii PR-910]